MLIKGICIVDSDEFNHIEIRMEQEVEPFNSFNTESSIRKSDSIGFTNDELYSMVYYLNKDNTMNLFKNDSRGYTEEINNFDNFEIIEPVITTIKLVNDISGVIKVNNQDHMFMVDFNLYNQYGIFVEGLKPTTQLLNDIEGVSYNDGLITISSNSLSAIELISSYGEIELTTTINVDNIIKQPTESERLALVEDLLLSLML